MSRLKDAILAAGRALDKVFSTETPPSRLTDTEVLRIARVTAEEQGWPWREPVSAVFGPGGGGSPGEWHVMTNAGHRGGNVNIWINDETGTVFHKGFARR